jgi:hypothetical protein
MIKDNSIGCVCDGCEQVMKGIEGYFAEELSMQQLVLHAQIHSI